MSGKEVNTAGGPTSGSDHERLDSWKEIAAYLKYSERTVRRWENEGLPVHRHPHSKKGTIYAYKSEIDGWWRNGHERLARLSSDAAARQPSVSLSSRWWKPVSLTLLVLLVGSMTARLFWRSETWVPQWPPRRLTANSNEDPVETAVISPDGRYVAYADTTGAYVREVSAGEPHRLDTPAGFWGRPVAWYPDNSHLLLQSVTTLEETPALWSASITGGLPRLLARNAWGAALSADGLRIAFIRNPVAVIGVCRLGLDCRYALGHEIWLMKANGAEPQEIAAGNAEDRFGSVAWSPDGQRIAYIRLHDSVEASKHSIEVRDLRTGVTVPVFADPRLRFFSLQPIMRWTSDGRIIFSLYETPPDQDDSNAWAIRINALTGQPTGKPQRITSGPGSISSFSATADGKRLVFIKDTLQPQIYLRELDAERRTLKNPRRLTLDQHGGWPFAWTPDNRAVIFASPRYGRVDVFRQYVDQPTPELLVEDPTTDKLLPRLTPDGTQVLYAAHSLAGEASSIVGVEIFPIWRSSMASTKLMRVPLSGGPPQFVLESPGITNLQCARAPATICIWSNQHRSPDGRILSFYSFDPITGTDHKIMDIRDERFFHWSLSADGLLLAVVAQDSHEGRIRLFSLPNGTARDLLVKGWSGLNTIDWAANSKTLFLSAIKPDGTTFLLNTDLRGSARPLLQQRNGVICWAIPSPDGKHLATMQMEGESNAWVLENF